MIHIFFSVTYKNITVSEMIRILRLPLGQKRINLTCDMMTYHFIASLEGFGELGERPCAAVESAH